MDIASWILACLNMTQVIILFEKVQIIFIHVHLFIIIIYLLYINFSSLPFLIRYTI